MSKEITLFTDSMTNANTHEFLIFEPDVERNHIVYWFNDKYRYSQIPHVYLIRDNLDRRANSWNCPGIDQWSRWVYCRLQHPQIKRRHWNINPRTSTISPTLKAMERFPEQVFCHIGFTNLVRGKTTFYLDVMSSRIRTSRHYKC